MTETNCSDNIQDKIELLRCDINNAILKFVSEQKVDVEITSYTSTKKERIGFRKRDVIDVETNIKIIS